MVRYQRLAGISLINKVIVFGKGRNSNQCVVIDTGTMKVVENIDARLAKAIEYVPRVWSVIYSVIGDDHIKKERWCKNEIMGCDQEYYQRTLVDKLNVLHEEMIAGVSKHTLVRAAWIASPNNVDFTESEIYDLYVLAGVYWGDNEC